MILYELRDPAVNKYGGTLTKEEAVRCTRETPLSPRWAPYPRRGIEVENVCGRFENFHGDQGWNGMDARLAPVCVRSPTPFGSQTELFHVRGQVCGWVTAP